MPDVYKTFDKTLAATLEAAGFAEFAIDPKTGLIEIYCDTESLKEYANDFYAGQLRADPKKLLEVYGQLLKDYEGL